MLDVVVMPSFGEMADRFNRLSKSIKNFRVPLKDSVSSVANPSIDDNFTAGGPGWAPLDDDTVSRKGHATLLWSTGKGQRAATVQARWNITAGFAAYDGSSFPQTTDYFALHQFGTENMPARPFVNLDRGDEQQIAHVFDEWLWDRVEAARLG